MALLWDTSFNYAVAYTGGGLTATATDIFGNTQTLTAPTGKWHVELTLASAAPVAVGIANTTWSSLPDLDTVNNFMAYGSGGFTELHCISALAKYVKGANWANGDIIAIEVDTSGKLGWIAVNSGPWNGSPTANPATGAEGIDLASLGSSFRPAILYEGAGPGLTLNAGTSAFSRTPSAGFTGPDAVSGVTGTAAIAEASDTSTATARLTTNGAASITEASDTVSALGTSVSTVSGLAAITETSDTLAASATLRIRGQAAITEASDIVTSSGRGPNVVSPWSEVAEVPKTWTLVSTIPAAWAPEAVPPATWTPQ